MNATPALVPLPRRIALLKRMPGFAELPSELAGELARSLHEQVFAPGAVIVAEGDTGDHLFLIESGAAEASTTGPRGAVSLAKLGAGDLFGEIALLAHSRERQATVKALSPLRTLTLSASRLDAALSAYPEARFDLVKAAEAMLRAKMAKRQGH